MSEKQIRDLGVKAHTLFLEAVISLEAAAEAIEGLAGFPDPESDGVDCFPKTSHLQLNLS